MKTTDKLFRMKEVLSSELTFWAEDIKRSKTSRRKVKRGSLLLNHWLTNANTFMAKLYAFVNVRGDGTYVFSVMVNGFSGFKKSPQDRIYDLKGSLRKSGSNCGKEKECKGANFNLHFPNGVGLANGPNSPMYTDLLEPMLEDVELLRELRVIDFSLVVKLTEAPGEECPPLFNRSRWADAEREWSNAGKYDLTWKGAGSNLCILNPLGGLWKPLRMTAILLDFLQHDNSWRNWVTVRMPKFIRGSKEKYNIYTTRFLDKVASLFRPFMFAKLLNTDDCVDNRFFWYASSKCLNAELFTSKGRKIDNIVASLRESTRKNYDKCYDSGSTVCVNGQSIAPKRPQPTRRRRSWR
jgi:hypothetical protein